MNNLQQQFDDQQFANEYQLVNGVAMHSENPDNFHVPPEVIKRHVRPGQYVELRIEDLGTILEALWIIHWQKLGSTA